METGGRAEAQPYVHEVDYVIEDDLPVIRIFGREKEGNTIVALSRDFRPYIYCLPEPGSNPRELARRIMSPEISSPAHVIDARVETKKQLGMEISMVRVTLDSPREVRTARSLLAQIPAVKDTFEKDILFKRRYMIDRAVNPLGLIQTEGRTTETTWPVDLVLDEATVLGKTRDSYLTMSELKILVFDIEVASPAAPNPQIDPIIMIGAADSKGTRVLSYGREGTGIETCSDERAMIARFISIVQEEDCDVLVGYNSDSFDLPYLRTRARRNGLRLRLGRDNSEVTYQPGAIMGRSIVRGRMNIDLYPPVRRMLNLPTYTLNQVYHHMSGQRKPEMSSENIYRLWQEGTDQAAARIAEYCISDVEATRFITWEVLPTLIELSKDTKQLLADVASMGQSQMVEWLLIREAHYRGELVPNKPTSAELATRREDTYEGGYVLEPAKGLKTNIVALDFRSLYPTIIVTHNVDMSTLDCECCPGENVSPTGHHFCTKSQGFIPSILSGLIERRTEIKQGLARLDPSAPGYKGLDAMQNALKILSNSFYGYSGYPRARWYSKECAESVAGWGREYIIRTIKSAEEEGFQVLYSDTDSIFITLRTGDPDALVSAARSFLKKVNASLPGIIELEYQGHSPRGFFVTKKRYALVDGEGRITTRGLEVVRRDWSPIAKETQRRVLMAILEDGDPAKAADEVRQAIRRVSERSVRLEDLVISTRMTKTIQSYDAEAPHVALAKRLAEGGEEVRQGTNIDYIVRKGTGRVGDRAQPVEQARMQDYDVDYYVRNQVLPPSMRILAAFGYRAEDLRYYRTKQKTLNGF